MIRVEGMLGVGSGWGLPVKIGLEPGEAEIKALSSSRNLHNSGLYLVWARLIFP